MTAKAPGDALRDSLAERAAHLEASKRALDQEIGSYPTPIPRCDAQFNHLYDERARVSGELEAVRAELARVSAGNDSALPKDDQPE